MEVGAGYNKKRLRGKKYFHELLERVDEIPDTVKDFLKMSRSSFELFQGIQKQLIAVLRSNLIRERVERLMTIQGVGEVIALTWALEIGDPGRFSSVRKTISYCSLCSRNRKQLKGRRKKNTSCCQNRSSCRSSPNWGLCTQQHVCDATVVCFEAGGLTQTQSSAKVFQDAW